MGACVKRPRPRDLFLPVFAAGEQKQAPPGRLPNAAETGLSRFPASLFSLLSAGKIQRERFG
jgi:hypothetical protein